MKKTITTLSISLLFALSAQAKDISGDYSVPANGESLSDKLLVTGVGTMTGGELTFMNATSATDIAEIKDDYTFSNKVNVSASGSTDALWATIKVSQGKTVEFADFNTSKMVMTSRAGVKFVSTATSDQTKYANVWLNSSDTNVFQQKSTQAAGKNYEVWLNYVNFHSQVSVDTKYHYVHMQSGANVICENDIYFETIAVREPFKKNGIDPDGKDTYVASDAFAGSVQMNGKNATIERLTYNPGYLTVGPNQKDSEGNDILNADGKPIEDVSGRTFAYVDFFIDFGENDIAQTLKIGNINESSTYNSWDLDQLIITNFGVGDRILIGQDLRLAQYKEIYEIITINGVDMTNVDVTDMGNGYWSYSVAVVPEPSTYALIFGALALGFVAYRRRK